MSYRQVKMEAKWYVQELREKMPDFYEVEPFMILLVDAAPDRYFLQPIPVVLARIYRAARLLRRFV